MVIYSSLLSNEGTDICSSRTACDFCSVYMQPRIFHVCNPLQCRARMVASILGVPRVAKRCTLLQTRDFASTPNVEVLLAVMVRV